MSVHDYDHKLTQIKIFNISIEDKKDACLFLIQLLGPKLSPAGNKNLWIIINSINTSSNHDKTNDILVEDILYILANKIKQDKIDLTDFAKLLDEQLCDMTTGFCPQGRVHRLYQLLNAF